MASPSIPDMAVLDDALPPTMHTAVFRDAAHVISATAGHRCLPFESVACAVLASVSSLATATQTIDLPGRWAAPRPFAVMQVGFTHDGLDAISSVVNRMPCGSPHVHATAKTLDEFRRLMSKQEAGGRGQPLAFAGTKSKDTLDVPADRSDQLAVIMAKVAALPEGRFRLGDEARELFEFWLTDRAAAPATNPVTEHLAALPYAGIHLVLALELLWWAAGTETEPPTELSKDAVLAGICLLEAFFVPHLTHLLRESGLSGRDSATRTLARWLLANRPESINVRILGRSRDLSCLRAAKTLDPAVEELVAAGWLAKIPHSGPGHPRSDYLVNPAVFEGGAP